jgi:hypothetical protein
VESKYASVWRREDACVEWRREDGCGCVEWRSSGVERIGVLSGVQVRTAGSRHAAKAQTRGEDAQVDPQVVVLLDVLRKSVAVRRVDFELIPAARTQPSLARGT